MPISRRQMLRQLLHGSSLLTIGSGVVNASTWTNQIIPLNIGPLQSANDLGLRLPVGVSARIVAVSGENVACEYDSEYEWHKSPDGGACFATEQGGWIYVSNAEEYFSGGAGAVEFDANGMALRAYPILEGTTRNCAGGSTPWGTWLSCEETDCGLVYETDPAGRLEAMVRPALGRFKHEAVAVDDSRGQIYLTEDEKDGCLYRFTPDKPFPYLDSGRLEVACQGEGGIINWIAVDNATPRAHPFATRTRDQIASAIRFRGGEGIWYQHGLIMFTTKGDNKVWVLDVQTDRLSVLYDALSHESPPIVGVDNLCGAPDGRMLVAEDGGSMQLVLLDAKGESQSLVQVVGQEESEITGPAFTPDGKRLYFSSQRGKDPDDRLGITYELSFEGLMDS
jgi:secreted PhoX family phosphatase